MTLLSLLSPRARALVDAGRSAQRPTALDRDRIQVALRARLGAEAFGPEAGASVPPAAAGTAGSGWLLAAGLVAGVGVVSGLVFLAVRAQPGPMPPRAGPPAVVASAVDDALSDLGVTVTRFPITPPRLLELIRAAQARTPEATP